MQIHISRNGETYGPYTPAQIEVLIHSGQLERTDEIWVQSSDWEPLSALGSFFGTPGEMPQDRLTFDMAVLREAPALSAPARDSGQSVLAATAGATRSAMDEEDGQENMMRMSFGL